MPSIARLGHVGLHVNDLNASTAFYRDVLGLTVTDKDPEVGMVFLSARPEVEHHELLLCEGRDTPMEAKLVQQVSFRCDTLEDVRGYYQRLRENDVRIDMTVSHGNAIGMYFYDPDGNRCEVYCSTGFEARQPYLVHVDLEKPADVLLSEVAVSVAEHGSTGYVEPRFLELQDIKPD